MANRIFIQDYNRIEDPMDFPLLDDPNLEILTQYGSFSDVIPKAADILDTVTLATAGTGGEVSSSILASKNLFDIPRWKKTEPIRIVATLVFDLKDDPENDIFEPMRKLMSYSMLTANTDGSYTVPGISLASVKAFQTTGGEGGIAKNAKLISAGIPGVIHLSVAIVERARPTYSKEITESGFPLWGKIDISIAGVFPANTKQFDDAKIVAMAFKLPPGI